MLLDEGAAKSLRLDQARHVVDRRRLTDFAASIGEDDPIYRDVESARAAGLRDVPVPPTYWFSLELEMPEPFGYLGQLGVQLSQILHGEQSFRYHEMAYAGDALTMTPKITDCYHKREGSLGFLVKETTFTRDGLDVASATTTIVVRGAA